MKTSNPKKVPRYWYSYNHATGLYSMDAASLTMWLMDTQGRAKLEKELAWCKLVLSQVGDLDYYEARAREIQAEQKGKS